MSHSKSKSGSPRFKVGDKVRVKPGVSDPDFPDMPSGRLVGDRHRDHQEHRVRSTVCSSWTIELWRVCTRSTASDVSGTDWISRSWALDEEELELDDGTRSRSSSRPRSRRRRCRRRTRMIGSAWSSA